MFVPTVANIFSPKRNHNAKNASHMFVAAVIDAKKDPSPIDVTSPRSYQRNSLKQQGRLHHTDS